MTVTPGNREGGDYVEGMDEIVKPIGVIDGLPTFSVDVDAIRRDLEERWANLPPADAKTLRSVAARLDAEAEEDERMQEDIQTYDTGPCRTRFAAERLRRLADTLD